MENLYGNLDLTVLGNLVRQHPELIREAEFKDGKHKLLNIDVYQKQKDQYGNVATIKASCKKDQQKQGVNYYLANLKVSQYQNNSQQQTQQPAPPLAPQDDSDLPF